MLSVAPKGSYHNYCRSNRTQSVQHSHRVRSIKTTRSNQRNHQPLQEFNDFQAYLRHLQNKEKNEHLDKLRPKTTDYRGANTSRPTTQPLIRQSKCNEQSKQKIDLIKPFFPFFKCRIEDSPPQEKLDTRFRLKNHRFKLNFRIIEENMKKREPLNDIAF